MRRLIIPMILIALVATAGLALAGPGVQPSNPNAPGAADLLTPNAATPPVVTAPAGPTDVQNLNTGTYYPTIDAAIADAATLNGHVIEVQVTPHSEGIVNVTKSVTIQGATGAEVVNASTSTTNSGDGRGWFLVTAPNVTVKDLNFDGNGNLISQGFRIKSTGGGASFSNCTFNDIRYQTSGNPYTGNAMVAIDCNMSVIDCSFTNIGRQGVWFFGTGCTAGVMSGCTYTGKGAGDWLDYGMEVGGGAVATATDNTVTDCVGVALSDSSSSAGMLLTTYFGAGTAGTLSGNVLTGNTTGLFAGYDSSDVTVISASDNDLSGNDFAGMVSTSNSVVQDASANWWGSNAPASVDTSQVGDIDYTPWLDSGTDTDGAVGFQGDFSVLDVDDDSPQTGASGRIQEGIDLVTASTVNVMPGTYAPFIVNTSVNLYGAQAGVDARGRVAGSPNPAVESVITGATRLLELKAGCAGSVIDGFAFSGGTRSIESTSGPLTGLQILNNHFSGMSGAAFFLNDSGADIDIDRNEFDGAGGSGTLCHLDQDNFAGLHFTNNNVLNRSAGTGLFCDGNHNIAVSATPRTPLIQGNVFDGNETGANLGRFAFTGGDILDNDFLNSGYDGLQGGIQNTTVSGNTFDTNGRFGFALTGFGGSGDATRGAQNLDISGNTFTNNVDSGLLFSSSQYPGTISTNVANGNDFVGNTTGVSYSGSETIDATCNWWGTIDGPNAPGNPSSGDPISGSTVQYAPWLDGSIAGSPTCDQYGNNYVSAQPDGDCLTASNTCETVPVVFSRVDTTHARGVSVTFQLSNELELCVDEFTSISQGTWLSGFGSTFQVYANGGGSYTVDQSILGLPCGSNSGGQLFTIDVKASGSASPTDVGTITITQVTVRDCNNGPLAGIPGPAATVDIDTVDPGNITDLAAVQDKSSNGTDGTTNIDLTWSLVTSPDAVTIELYRAGFGYYPEYDDLGGSVPASPSYPPAGPWTLAATLPSSATSYSDEPTTRDYWYYAAFVIDACGNVSSASNMTDGTLNYHLGDFGTTLDNKVMGDDLSALGATYGESDGDAFYDNTVDIGPTDDNSVDGLPTTDNVIQFEDLILFAINYGQVSKPMPGVLAADVNAVSLEVPEDARGTFEVVIGASSDGTIQGLSVPLTWNAEAVEPVGYAGGELMDRQSGRGVVLSPKAGTVDAAVFGSTLSGEGELARVTFRRIGSGDPAITFGDVDARDRDNQRVELGTTAIQPPVSAVTRLLPAAPNPFLGATGIRYALKDAGRVEVSVYALDGRLVRTLVSGMEPAGERTVTWDGRDAGGREVASGAYLIRFRAAGHSQTQRVIRLK